MAYRTVLRLRRLLLLAVLATPARAGEAPLKQIKDPNGVCTLDVPATWGAKARRDTLDVDPEGEAYADLTVTARARRHADLKAFADAQVAATKQAYPGWTEVARAQVQVGGLPAVHVQAKGRISRTDCRFDCYFVLTPRHQVELAFTCQSDAYAAFAEAWKAVLASVCFAAEQPVAPEVQEVRDATSVVTMSVPKDWQVKRKEGTIQATEPGRSFTATISLVRRNKAHPSLEKSVAERLGHLKRAMAKFAAGERSAVRLGGHAGTKIRYTCEFEGKPLLTDLWLVQTPRHEVELSCTAVREQFAQHEAVFQAAAASVRIAEAGAAESATAKLLKDPMGLYSVWVPKAWQVDAAPDQLAVNDPSGQIHVACSARPKQHETVDQLAEARIQENRQRWPVWQEEERQRVGGADQPGVRIRVTAARGDEKSAATLLYVLGAEHAFALICACLPEERERFEPIFALIMGSWRFGRGTPPAPAPDFPEIPALAVRLRRYDDPGGLFSFAVPATWKPNLMQNMAMVSSPDSLASLSVFATPRMPYPVAQWAQTTIQQNQAFPNWRLVKHQEVKVSGQPAALIIGERGAGQQVAVEITVLVQVGQHQGVLALRAPKAAVEQAAGLYDQIIGSFRFGPPQRPPAP